MAGIEQLIINSAFREPEHHWKYDLNGQCFVQEPGRRPAGYFVAGQGSNQYNDIGQFIELPLVNLIRPRVKAWRQAGCAAVDMEASALLNTATFYGMPAAAVLLCSDKHPMREDEPRWQWGSGEFGEKRRKFVRAAVELAMEF